MFKQVIKEAGEEPFDQLRKVLGSSTADFEKKLQEFLRVEAYPEIVPPLVS